MTKIIKSNNQIVTPKKDVDLQQYAGDLTTITSNPYSDKVAENEIKRFCKISGLEIHGGKTQKMHIELEEKYWN